MVSVRKEAGLCVEDLKNSRSLGCNASLLFGMTDVQYLSWTHMQSFSVRPFLYCDDAFPRS